MESLREEIMSTQRSHLDAKDAVISYGFGGTEIGPALAAWTERGLCLLRLMTLDRRKAVHELQERYPHARLVADEAGADAVFQHVEAFLAGKKNGKLDIVLEGTPFQKKVWQALRRIPHGQTQTYQQIARQIGKPRAVRAVGNACGANPVGILVPCHRVVGSDGSLGGYYWGLKVKQKLLERERC
jgi:AraC family transcriptional regulator, regulatory protein of adaptative response / methylated-DNA-[protein]-cysteine methyltransferase